MPPKNSQRGNPSANRGGNNIPYRSAEKAKQGSQSNKGAPAKGDKKPAPASKTDIKTACPRCIEAMWQFGAKPHQLNKCIKAASTSLDSYKGAWPACATLGTNSEQLDNLQECDALLDSFIAGMNPTHHEGTPVTKWLLENAWKKVYPDQDGSNEAEKARKSKAPSAGTSGAAAAQAGPSLEPPVPLDTTQTFELATELPDNIKSAVVAKTYDYAVHKDCILDTTAQHQLHPSQQFGTGQRRLTVATNYVTVNKFPTTLYVYNVAFGTTTMVQTKRQIVKAEKKAKKDEKQAKNKAGSQTKTDDASGPIQGRGVSQRSEKALIFKALRSIPPFSDVAWASDFSALWSLQPLDSAGQVQRSLYDVVYAKLSGRKHKLDRITFSYQRTLELESLSQDATKSLLNLQDANARGGSMHTTALNALISHHVTAGNSDNLIAVGPNKFFLKKGYTRCNIIDIHRGYFTSIRPGFDRVLLNVNCSTAAFFRPMWVRDVYKLAERNRDYGTAEDILKGLNVRIAYERKVIDPEYDPNLEENRVRKIAGFGRIPSIETALDGSKLVRVSDYFAKLGIDCTKSVLPCISLNVAPPKPDSGRRHQTADAKAKAKDKPHPIWVPAEFLQILPYQPFNKRLMGNHSEDMLNAALHAPAMTQDLIINEGFSQLGIGQGSTTFDELQLDVGSKLLSVPARLLPTPAVQYGNNKMATVSAASWNVQRTQFYEAPRQKLKTAVCTIDMLPKPKDQINDLGLQLTETMMGHGIPFGDDYADTHRHCSTWRDAKWAEKLRREGPKDAEWLHNFERDIKAMGLPKMLVVVLPDNGQNLYGVVKRTCDQKLGSHTVCVTVQKLGKKLAPLLSNLALKMNMKLGGKNHRVCIPDTSVSAFKDISADTIVFGADVAHPAGSMPYTPSIAAVVASTDKDFINFPGSMRLQAGTQEMITDLADMVQERLEHFVCERKFLPKRIMFYRDGVSEDQFQACRTEEIPQIKQAWEAVRANQFANLQDELKLTFIVVGKRHNTRFFATKEQDTYPDTKQGDDGHIKHDRKHHVLGTDAKGNPVIEYDELLNGNLKPGLIVDQIITRPHIKEENENDEAFDFFLQSHAALKGTARSAHYTVLSRGALSTDQIQSMTHAFCYNYARATKGVSYAGPAYIADRLCDRGSHYLRGYTDANPKGPGGLDWQEGEDEAGFSARVARHISTDPAWAAPGRKNPWHPNFDKVMFWL